MKRVIKDNEGNITDNIMYVPKPTEWFVARIGKRIYRDMQGEKHCCSTCQHVAENGLTVGDEMHADYLANTDACFSAESGIFSNYRDKL